jgi:hypothetical protein
MEGDGGRNRWMRVVWREGMGKRGEGK